ncbi:MAG: tetratricopeptide repeat protein [Xenophilus sp.]
MKPAPGLAARLVPLCAALCLPLAAGAVAAVPSSDLPDLSAEKALIYSGDYAQAAGRLQALSRDVHHAEVYNLLGYSLRHLRRYGEAAQAYKEALYHDGSYRPALEYQGELFIETGDVEAARKNLRDLRLLCGTAGCAELDQLRKALAAAGHPPGPDE